MKICLINPPFLKDFSRQQRSPAVIKSGVLYYPYWLSYTTGVLEADGIDATLIDAIARRLNGEETIQFVCESRAPLAVIESSTPSIQNDLAFCWELKAKHPKILILLVGTHPSVMYEDILTNHPSIDAVAIGEYEYTVRDLARVLTKDDPWHDIQGLAFKKNGAIVKTVPRPLITHLDELPFVSRAYKKHLNIHHYYFSLANYPMVMLITSRGCPNQCFFCVYSQTLHGRNYRFRSPENVVDEILYIQNELPEVKEIVFEDDTFTVNEKRVRSICRLIQEKNLSIKWFANVRVETSYETLKAMKEAGFRRCAVGFESGNQDILNAMGKGTTLEQAVEFKMACDRLGILVHGCFMVGFPGETHQTMRETFDFATKLNCDSAQFYPLFLYPGTNAFEWAKANGYLRTDDYAQWLTPDGFHNCIYDLPGLSAEEMMDFCERAYSRYYLSIPYLFRKLKQSLLHSSEAKRNFNAGCQLIRYIITRSSSGASGR